MHLFKFPPPSYFHTLLLFLVTSFIFTGCKKTGDVIKKDLPENISKQELLLWINKYQKLMPDGPKPILEQSLKTYYKGQMILKMPLSSGGGNLYFTKTDKLYVQFIRIVSYEDQVNKPFTGYYEFIDMNLYTYKKVIFKQGVRQAEVKKENANVDLIQNTSTVKSTETWLGAFLYCLAKYVFAYPKKFEDGTWGCNVLSGNIFVQIPGIDESGGGATLSIEGGAGPGIDWFNWFNSINWPGLSPSYPDGGGNVGAIGFWTPFGADGNGLFPNEIVPDINEIGIFTDVSDIYEDDPVQITFDYDQNPWPILSNVLTPNQFVGYYINSNCLSLAKSQIDKLGLRDLGYGSAFKVHDVMGGPYPNIAKSGVNYIISKLKLGKPVIVGIDNRPGTLSLINADGKTDHFVTIVGSGIDNNGIYFTFYDNATNNEIKGTSIFNRLYYNASIGNLTGKSVVPYANSQGDYIVTQIRKNQ